MRWKKQDQRFVVTVWDWGGDIVKKLWDATAEEAEEVSERYSDEPMYSVHVEMK